MWVLTENGRLINLDHFYVLEVAGPQNEPVVVAHGEPDISVVLCSCDNEEHGREVIRHIADALANGDELYDIRDAKVYVYICDVCALRFEVPRRGDNVHFLRGTVVCPDCWAAGQDEEAGSAVQ